MRSNVCSLNAFSVEGKHIGCKQRAGVQNPIMVTLSARALFYVNCFILLSTITDTLGYQMQTLYLSILVRKSGIQEKACQWSVRNFPKFTTFPFQTIACIISSIRKKSNMPEKTLHKRAQCLWKGFPVSKRCWMLQIVGMTRCIDLKVSLPQYCPVHVFSVSSSLYSCLLFLFFSFIQWKVLVLSFLLVHIINIDRLHLKRNGY